MYNLLDVNQIVVESNLSEEAVIALLEHTNGDGFTYFHLPVELDIIEKLKLEKGETLRFIKREVVNQ